MEASVAVAAVPESTVSTTAVKSTGLGKTNIDFATHHILMARQSIARATERLHDMTVGKSGAFPQRVADVKHELEDSRADMERMTKELNKILDEVQELLG